MHGGSDNISSCLDSPALHAAVFRSHYAPRSFRVRFVEEVVGDVIRELLLEDRSFEMRLRNSGKFGKPEHLFRRDIPNVHPHFEWKKMMWADPETAVVPQQYKSGVTVWECSELSSSRSE